MTHGAGRLPRDIVPDTMADTAKHAAPPRLVSCPQCGHAAPWDPANRFRPFCSERCKLIDLGQWASEGYRIPVASEPDGSTDLPPADET